MKVHKIITGEMVNNVSNMCKSYEYDIRKYDMDGYCAFIVGGVRINRYGNGTTDLCLKETMDREYMSLWRNDVGGLLLKEIKKHNGENLYELIFKTYKILVKRVLDDEVEDLAERGLIHLVLGDLQYTIIKIVQKDNVYVDKGIGEQMCMDIELFSNMSTGCIDDMTTDDTKETKNEESDYEEQESESLF